MLKVLFVLIMFKTGFISIQIVYCSGIGSDPQNIIPALINRINGVTAQAVWIIQILPVTIETVCFVTVGIQPIIFGTYP